MNSFPKVGIITQARMQSTRLPGKVLMEIGGKPVLLWHIERLFQEGFPVIVATSTLDADQPIIDFCEDLGVDYFRGDEQDVLERFYEAANHFKLDAIVRVTSDCPLIDGGVISRGIEAFRKLGKETAYISNTFTRTYPRGFDFEIFSRFALDKAHKEARSEGQREHVTPFIWRDNPEIFEISQITRHADASQYRLTLDTTEDLTVLQKMIEDHGAGALDAEAIINILDAHPEIASLNAEIEQKKTQK